MTALLGPHAVFIAASYVAAFVVIAGLIAWVSVDHLLLTRRLADFERRGVRRRSANPASVPPSADRSETRR